MGTENNFDLKKGKWGLNKWELKKLELKKREN